MAQDADAVPGGCATAIGTVRGRMRQVYARAMERSGPQARRLWPILNSRGTSLRKHQTNPSCAATGPLGSHSRWTEEAPPDPPRRLRPLPRIRMSSAPARRTRN
jgi:hypothetical protein